MESQMIFDWALAVSASLLAAAATLYWVMPRKEIRSMPRLSFKFLDNEPIWIFDDTRLADATPIAHSYLHNDDLNPNWHDLRECLSGRFPDFPLNPRLDSEMPVMEIPGEAEDDEGYLSFEYVGGLTRVHLREGHSGDTTPEDGKAKEAQSLRDTLNLTPYPIWTLDKAGNVSECNHAYSKLAKTSGHDEEDQETSVFPILQSDIESGNPRRVPVVNKDTGEKNWFDIQVVTSERSHLCFAINVDPVVEAENAQRNFVQTLAKTFAQLSIGLAIFDRQRQLILFNPALIDLTNLSAEFLSGRPTLFSFFDRMRDQRMMPEPKDYGTWRQKISELIDAATLGSYQETWTLPTGSVYAISGRPHPDGAIAFLFEDITAEITLTRRFRSDIELSQAILDQIEDAIVVFSGDGTITVTNEAYRKLWRTDPENSFATTTVIDSTRIWQDLCKATPVWGEIRDFVALRENRVEWFAEVTQLTGQRLKCQVSPINKGSSIVVFSQIPESAESVPVLLSNSTETA